MLRNLQSAPIDFQSFDTVLSHFNNMITVMVPTNADVIYDLIKALSQSLLS